MPIYDPVVLLKEQQIQIAETARVDSFVKIEGGRGVTVGEYTHICSFAHLNIGGGMVMIGDHISIASGAKVLGGTHTPNGVSMSAVSPLEMQNVERSVTVVDDFAFVGVNAVVMPGVHVGRGAVIGAGAVVTKSVPAWEIWAGVPAVRIGCRRANEGLGYELPEHA